MGPIIDYLLSLSKTPNAFNSVGEQVNLNKGTWANLIYFCFYGFSVGIPLIILFFLYFADKSSGKDFLRKWISGGITTAALTFSLTGIFLYFKKPVYESIIFSIPFELIMPVCIKLTILAVLIYLIITAVFLFFFSKLPFFRSKNVFSKSTSIDFLKIFG